MRCCLKFLVLFSSVKPLCALILRETDELLRKLGRERAGLTDEPRSVLFFFSKQASETVEFSLLFTDAPAWMISNRERMPPPPDITTDELLTISAKLMGKEPPAAPAPKRPMLSMTVIAALKRSVNKRKLRFRRKTAEQKASHMKLLSCQSFTVTNVIGFTPAIVTARKQSTKSSNREVTRCK